MTLTGTQKPDYSTRGSPISAFKDWVVKRGVLYLLTQTPMIAFLIAVAFRWTTLPIATAYSVILAFIVLPIWISYRKSRSTDPEEPAHDFHKLAVWSLVPYTVYNIARIPMFYLLGVAFWNHWAGYGTQLTGQGALIGQLPGRWSSLIAGILIHSIQGYVLVLGYYVLFKRRTLVSALLYVWVMLSLIYSTVFPYFILVDFRPGAKWYFVVWWAHFWMAIAAWYVPKHYGFDFRKWFRSSLAKALALGLVILVYLLPVAFVIGQSVAWQWPLQHSIDQNTFRLSRMVLNEDPVLISKESSTGASGSAQEALYKFTLTFGPRQYTDWIKATKALEAGPIQVVGKIVYKGEVIASCFRQVALLESPAVIRNPAEYLPTLKRLEFSSIDVECTGGAQLADGLAVGTGDVFAEVHWNALATLIGDREKTQRTYGGIARRDIIGGTWTSQLLRADPSAEGLVRQAF